MNQRAWQNVLTKSTQRDRLDHPGSLPTRALLFHQGRRRSRLAVSTQIQGHLWSESTYFAGLIHQVRITGFVFCRCNIELKEGSR